MKLPVSFILLLVILLSCGRKPTEKMFRQLSVKESGIDFRNEIHDSDSTYSFINEFGYMGGGVGIGDFNNDGLKDIFFSGNQVSSRLYINKGNNRFEDITERAGVKTNVWATGVSIVDINSDGFDDIYVCVIGKDLSHRAGNLLFINQHNLSFKEQAGEYGLADTGYSTQAAFLDYDRDGDLDMYLVNYLLADRNANTIYPRDFSGRSPANDKLYRNDTDSLDRGHPVFTDISATAGILEDGYGLAASVSDYNDDGWPDIYVANDFLSNDEMWLNNGNGSFTNCISRSLQHQSYSSMGADAADINNDGLPDIAVVDMLPADNERKKTSFSFMNYERYQAERQMGYEPEFMRNVLQLNNGCYKAGDTLLPFFSEIGQLAGIQATDWSWSVLMADFDNDGWKDMYITNGTGRDFINADFLEFSSGQFASSGSKEEKQKAIREKLVSLKHVSLPDYLFLNKHDFTFADISEQAGINEPSMSNGAAYADLDNDGDLDIVVNNINKEAFVFVNNTIQKGKPAVHHFVKLRLVGDSMNQRGIGTKIFLYSDNKVQLQEQYPVRGYFSTVDPDILFGLDTLRNIDSIVVIWPNSKKQVLMHVPVDTTLILSLSNTRDFRHNGMITDKTLFTDITNASGIGYLHRETSFDDFAVQRLLQQKYSQMGPFITTADINNDGATDFFIGGALNFSGQYFIQQKGSGFTGKTITDSIKMEEDMDCVFFDADLDGDMDLLVTGGDVQFDENSGYYQPRFYVNDGNGNFRLQTNSIPASVKTIGGCCTTADYDSDGDLDLFIGGRVSKRYPTAPRSFVLQNNKGKFSDVTETVCSALKSPGMITSAVWTDFDNDKQVDLVIAGEWMPVRFFKNDHGRLKEVTDATGISANNGMWRSLVAADMDNDGDADLVAGNLGMNTEYKSNEHEPMQLYNSDMDGNGSLDPVMFYYIRNDKQQKELYPSISRGMLATQVPSIKKKFLLNKDYAQATAATIFKGQHDDESLWLKCHETASCYFENLGNGRFAKRLLPVEAQFSCVNAIICDDLDGDGFKDLLIAGNEYQAEVMTGRYDASYGYFLKGNGHGSFLPVGPTRSGFRVRGDVKDLALVNTKNGQKLILVAINNDSLRVFRVDKL